jgi:type IV fimbrial biogenesis protein FimT
MRPITGHRTVGSAAGGSGGFTLVELLTVITIIGILAAIALPSFASLIANQRAGSAATDMLFALATARSEATKRSVNVTLSRKGSSWSNGWQIFDPADGTKKLLDHDALAESSVTASLTSVVYLSSGRIQGATKPTFTITMTTGNATATKRVCVDLSGRPFVSDATCP